MDNNSVEIPVVGIVGGIGSGKSTVARGVCEQYPAAYIDADAAGHQVLTEKPIQEALRRHFGDEIFDETGSVDRGRLGRRVFGTTQESNAAKQELEKIVHPRIGEILAEQIRAARSNPDNRAVMLDAAVMLESGWKDFCRAIVFVDVPLEMRRNRVMQNRGWTAEELTAREASQMPLDEKRRLSDHIIDNSKSADFAVEQLREFLAEIAVSR